MAEERGEPAQLHHRSAPRSRCCLTQAEGARPGAGAWQLPSPAQQRALGHHRVSLRGCQPSSAPAKAMDGCRQGKRVAKSPQPRAPGCAGQAEGTARGTRAALWVRHHQSKPTLSQRQCRARPSSPSPNHLLPLAGGSLGSLHPPQLPRGMLDLLSEATEDAECTAGGEKKRAGGDGPQAERKSRHARKHQAAPPQRMPQGCGVQEATSHTLGKLPPAKA